MITFLICTGVMCLGAMFLLWIRAVFAARSDRGFDSRKFLIENRDRLVLILVGVVIVSALMIVDAAGIATLLEMAGLPIKIGSHGVLGAAIAALVLVVPKEKK